MTAAERFVGSSVNPRRRHAGNEPLHRERPIRKPLHELRYELSDKIASGPDNSLWFTRYVGTAFQLVPGATPLCRETLSEVDGVRLLLVRGEHPQGQRVLSHDFDTHTALSAAANIV